MTLQVDDYEVDAISELADLDLDTFRSVRWRSLSPWFQVVLTESRVAVSATGSDPGLRGAAERVGDVLRRCRRPLLRALGMSWPLAGAALGTFVVLNFQSAWWSLALYPALLWWLLALWVTSHRAVVVAVRRSQRTSFWKRRGDDVRILVIGIVLGVIPTAVITYLTTKAQTKP